MTGDRGGRRRATGCLCRARTSPNQGPRCVRVGDTVRRPLRSTSAATHALLRHLEEVGSTAPPGSWASTTAAARCSATSPARPVVPPYPDWALTDEALVGVAGCCGATTAAAASFDPRRTVAGLPAGPVRRRAGRPQRPEPGQRRLPRRARRRAHRLRPRQPRLPAVGRRLRGPAVGAAPTGHSGSATPGAGRALARFRVFVDAYGTDDLDLGLLVPAVQQNQEWFSRLIDRYVAAAAMPGSRSTPVGGADARGRLPGMVGRARTDPAEGAGSVTTAATRKAPTASPLVGALLAPPIGLEPITLRLTVACSAN